MLSQGGVEVLLRKYWKVPNSAVEFLLYDNQYNRYPLTKKAIAVVVAIVAAVVVVVVVVTRAVFFIFLFFSFFSFGRGRLWTALSVSWVLGSCDLNQMRM